MPELNHWHAKSANEALARLQASPEGLSTAEAHARLARFGPNALPQVKPPSALKRFAAQFKDVLIIVLLVASAITALIGHTTDAAVILGVVIINAIIGFVQEGKAQRALEAVHSMLAATAIVQRDGVRSQVSASELVPGDIVWLTAGDRVPADLRLLKAKNLRLQEAALTGESAPVDKNAQACAAQTVLAERVCMAYCGTGVSYGSGQGVVCSTGVNTELGQIGALVSGVEALQTPLTRKLDQLARRLTVFVLIASALALLLGVWLHHYALSNTFLAVVGLAVAAIPAGLPAIVAITLAIGTQRMAKRHAMLRRLPAVEALGSVTLICTDKTGTLTQNEMTAVRVALAEGELTVSGVGYAPKGQFSLDGAALPTDTLPTNLRDLALVGLLCNDACLRHTDSGTRLVGDPTEGALLTLAAKAGLDADELTHTHPRLDEIAFDSERQWMATLHPDFIALKGAPERVLALCSTQGQGSALDHKHWHAQINAAAQRGERVLALARALVPSDQHQLSAETLPPQFCFLGLVSMIDPPREQARQAVAACRTAGIRVLMITGDHALTASAIGQSMGFESAQPLTGSEIDSLSDATLSERLKQTEVIARASPQHKLRLVQLAQQAGHIVAMTGDGANDAPALKRADVGVAMGKSGTDAAREAADLVLLDDNFATLASAVRAGRNITDNIKKALVFMLPANGGEAGVILLAVFLGFALPITALQILWINMVTTVTQDIALAFETAEKDIMQRPPRPAREPLLTPLLLARVTYVSALLIAMTFGVYHFELARGMSIDVARTAAVNALAFGELFYLVSCRRFVEPAWARNTWAESKVLYTVSAILIVLQMAITYAPPLQSLFGTAALDAASWALILALSLVKLLVVEAEKAVLRWRKVQRF